MTLDLSTTVARIPLETCIYNASGPRSGTAEALEKVAASSAGAVLSKSATIHSQTGNPQPRTWHASDNMASLNSEGLPNKGIDYYIDGDTIDAIQLQNKPYLVSLSGKTLADNLEMLKRIAKIGHKKIAGIELNVACPNVIGKPIIGYDLEQLEDILQKVTPIVKPLQIPLGLKLPPYLDMIQFQQVASILNKHDIQYVVTMNTLGNATAVDIDADMCVTSSNDGYAGLSGPAVHYTACANVRQLRRLLDDRIDIVGCGGVASGSDVYRLLLCGATAVQVGTTHWKEGPQSFDRIASELREIMIQKGKTSVKQVIGQLKPWSREGATLARQATKAKTASSSETTTQQSDVYKNLSMLLAVAWAVTVFMWRKEVEQRE